MRRFTVSSYSTQSDSLLIKRLEIWSTEYIRINAQITDLLYQLADKGVVISNVPPTVGPADTLETIRIKEKLTALHQCQQRIIKGIDALGATLIDTTTMEILIPGGPLDNSYLSWQPGESSICYWRKKADIKSVRQLLETEERPSILPTLH